MKINCKFEKGFTLIELLIYALFLAVIGVAVVTFFIWVVNIGETSRRGRESLDNAKRAMDVISQEIKHAKSVYTPTSTLGSHPGQLSLETERDLPTDEKVTFVDLYLDDDRLYMRREGQAAQLVVSNKVKVTSLIFTLLNADSEERAAIRTQVTVEYVDPIRGSKTPVSLVSTTSLRSYEDN